VPGCPNGGLLTGTDGSDRLAGREGEDEVLGLGGSDLLSGGYGSDVVYGGLGNYELQGGGYPPVEFTNDMSKNVLHGGRAETSCPASKAMMCSTGAMATTRCYGEAEARMSSMAGMAMIILTTSRMDIGIGFIAVEARTTTLLTRSTMCRAVAR
jgi:hypothetical protein